MKELSKRILRKLEIEDTRILCNEDEVQKPCPQRQYYPIYPSVLKILGFKERSYQLLASLHGCELPVLSGINEILDKFVEENRDKNEVFELDSNLDFRGYMLIYIRILRGAIRI